MFGVAKVTWNYRVVKFEDTGEYFIHSAYYCDGNKKPALIGKDPSTPFGGSKKELKEELLKMLAALEKPVLKYGDF